MATRLVTLEALPIGLRRSSSLRVGAVNDPAEMEAEAVAERVMRMPDAESALIQRCPGGCPDEEVMRRQPVAEEEDELQRQPVEDEEELQLAAAGPGSSGVDAVTASAIGARRGGGTPLPGSARRFFEPRFGADLSDVRVHHDGEAASLARSVNARAFTVGRDVFFGPGEWAPNTGRGDRLLAHELTHTLQQDKAGRTISERYANNTGGSVVRRAFSVTYDGCGLAPFDEATVSAAAREAYDKINTSKCIADAGFRKSILSEFDGMKIECEQRADGPCGSASRHLSNTVNIFPKSLALATCGPLKSTILHEAIHLTELALFGHGDLAGACEAACFGYGSGNPADCTAPAPALAQAGVDATVVPLGLPGVGVEAGASVGLPLETTGTIKAFAGANSTLVLGLEPDQRNAFMIGGVLGIAATIGRDQEVLNVMAEAQGGAANLELGTAGGLDPFLMGRLAAEYRTGNLTVAGEASAGAVFDAGDSPDAYFGLGVRLGLRF